MRGSSVALCHLSFFFFSFTGGVLLQVGFFWEMARGDATESRSGLRGMLKALEPCCLLVAPRQSRTGLAVHWSLGRVCPFCMCRNWTMEVEKEGGKGRLSQSQSQRGRL